ncbi:hypothetical protein VNO78_28975 [Psophocarpus tetragonolobus]|uniref:Uncharacterized protein n=1 Tax=Psophocarpus tetragonolobus TaxID=3891 RepID=A0AAN9RU73_PSOTE
MEGKCLQLAVDKESQYSEEESDIKAILFNTVLLLSLRLQLEKCEAELLRLREKKKEILEARSALDVPFTF